MIGLSALHIGDPCPCGAGMRIWLVDVPGDQFCCANASGSVGIKHAALPGGGYTNLTNVAVTIKTGLAAAAEEFADAYRTSSPRRWPVDLTRYPHRCLKCGQAAYLGGGPGDVEHAATGKAGCG